MKPLNLFFTALCLVALGSCAPKSAQENFYTLKNEAGMQVTITPYGGRISSILVPDRNSKLIDVVLGFENMEDYYPGNNQTDFGASIGRYANRIAQGRFTLDGVEYDLPKNNFGHCLHGGPSGWQYQLYEVVEADSSHLKLKIVSPDGDNGFPGEVTAYTTYTLTEGNAIEISYEAVTTAPTVINMTNHSYFNLSGDPAHHSVCDDLLYVNASAFTPVDSTYMTTGEIRPVESTPFDFREPRLIGERIGADDTQIRNGNGYDHNWVLDTKGDMSEIAVSLVCPESGVKLDVYTDEPGIQIYSGNFLDGSITGKGGVKYTQRSGICFETQKYPDTPNKPQWPSAVLRPGETYRSHCTFAFSTVAESITE